MQLTKATWIVCGCLTAVVVVAGALPSLLARPANCGGNSAALNNCKHILVYSSLFASTNSFLPDGHQMETEDRDGFLKLGEYHWTGAAQYWVRTNNFTSKSPTQIVVFCEQKFDNVPQPTFLNLYKRTPAYAVGFADGSTRLISPADFAHFDKHDFTPLATLKENYRP